MRITGSKCTQNSKKTSDRAEGKNENKPTKQTQVNPTKFATPEPTSTKNKIITSQEIMYKFYKLNLLAFLFALLCLNTNAQKKDNVQEKDYVQWVNPFIGTGGHGHTFPGATVPFGMVQLSPDTRLEGWDGCSGYHYTDEVVYGFSHTHLSGTGVSDYGDILLMPTTGKPIFNNGADGQKGYSSPFSKSKEVAKAGFYSTHLDKYNIDVELTASERAGFHKYTFPENTRGNVVLDLEHRDNVINSKIKQVSETELEGFRLSNAWAEEQHVYYVIQFSQPFQSMSINSKGARGRGNEVEGTQLKSVVQFGLEESNQLLVRVGISSVSIESARKNLEAEIAHWDFKQTRQEASDKWNKALSKIDIEGGSKDQQTVFYTALYHTMIAPNLFMDVDGKYRGTDLQVHQAKDYEHYTIFSLWDTYRATHPLYTLIEQERTNDFIKTFLAQYQDGGQLPIWELSANYTGCMIGYHSIPVIADAYVKGIRDYDADLAMKAMIHSATQDKLGLADYKKFGFIPAESEGESVSKTLEYAYDDWCIAQMAKEMNKPDVYKEYLKRGQYYKNMYDPETGFLRARMNNAWFSPFKPEEVNFNYTEANAWQYSLYTPQDITGLYKLMGGKEKLETHLDKLFTANSATSGRNQADITGLIGQYAHGNEPSHHMAYMYNFVNKPMKNQERVRQIMEELYKNAPDGLSGNEDCGQMSAWYVLSAMGIYPVTPGSENYIIGSPLFDKATINLENGKQFIISSKNNGKQNIYIENASLNGQNHQQSYIKHKDIVSGGELSFTMANSPSDWGVQDSAVPVSSIEEHLLVVTPIITKGNHAFYGSETIELETLNPEASIFYTIDGSQPNEDSNKYNGPFQITEDCTLKMFAQTSDGEKSATVESDFVRIKSFRKIDLATDYASHYSAGGDDALVNAIRGGNDFHSGTWQGYEQVDLIATVDLGKKEKVSNLTIGFLQDENSWIFMPEKVTFYASTNGQKFTELGTVESNISPKERGVILKDFSLQTDTKAKYIKVVANNRGFCPDYHKGAGGKCWIFADEILIK